METPQKELQSIVVQGWTVMLILYLGMLVATIGYAAIQDDLAPLAIHPGLSEAGTASIIVFIYALMTMAVRLIDHGWFRWFNAGLLTLVTLHEIAHQAGHVMNGASIGLLGMIEFGHHVIGLLTVVMAVRWARHGKNV
jgi:hypothetical protein